MAPWSPFNWGRSAKDAPPSLHAPAETEAAAKAAATPSIGDSMPEKPPQVPATINSATTDSSIFSRRSIRQLGLFFGGASLLALSVMVSRRAVIRHKIASRLRFYSQNQWQTSGKEAEKNKRDPTVALEALNLATLNVASFAIMLTGGLSFAFDISSVEELRARARKTLYEGSSSAEADAEAEKQVAEWVSKVLKIHIPDESNADEGKKKSEKVKASEN